jgi:hypothetical protein
VRIPAQEGDPHQEGEQDSEDVLDRQVRAVREGTQHARRQETKEEPAEKRVRAQQHAENRPREGGVRHRDADQRHLHQHDEGRQEGAARAAQHARRGRPPDGRACQSFEEAVNHRKRIASRWPERFQRRPEQPAQPLARQRGVEGAVERDLAAIQQQGAPHPGREHGEIVRDVKERQPSSTVDPVDDGQHFLLDGDVQVGGRLVHQQDVGLLEDGAGKRHLLPLATGKLAQRPGREMRHPHRLQKPHRLFPILLPRRPEQPDAPGRSGHHGLQRPDRNAGSTWNDWGT